MEDNKSKANEEVQNSEQKKQEARSWLAAYIRNLQASLQPGQDENKNPPEK